MVTKEKILETLKTVHAPGQPQNAVAMGMIRQIFVEDQYVRVCVELTLNSETARGSLDHQIQEKVGALEGVKGIAVEFAIRGKIQTPLFSPASAQSSIAHVIAVASGKGGVGKTTVAVNLALALARQGNKVGLMDGDIYGPNIPIMLGISPQTHPAATPDHRMIPIEVEGLRMISMGILVPPDQPMIWRGPKLHGVIAQFVQKVDWGELDYLLVDLPPGTGDVQLSLIQNVTLSGAVIVTTPQEVALLDVRKGIVMFQKTHVPILGVIENMTGEIFGSGGGRRAAEQFGAAFLGEIPLDMRVRVGGDSGNPIVLAHPDSPAALSFFNAAQMLAASVQQTANRG